MGLRETKKLATRQQIAGAAMHLFVTRGFDHVTVAEVATAAGVSEKTVFNYFPTKEDLFFDEVPERLRLLADGIRNRAVEETVLHAMRRMQLTEVPRFAKAGFEHFAQVLADLLQEEGLPERDARIAASLLVGVHRQFFRLARRMAIEGKHGPSAVRRLKADIARAYELLEGGLGPVLP